MVAKQAKKTVRKTRRKTGFSGMPTDNFEKSKHYVQYEIENREWVVAVKDYCKKNLTKKQSQAINSLPDWEIGFGSHWATAAYYMTNNMIVPEPYASGFAKRLENLITKGKQTLEKKKKPKAEKPNIQQRIFEQSQDACEKIEDWLEEYIKNPENFNPDGLDVMAHFDTMQVTQAHARKIKKMYEPWLQEAIEVSKIPTQSKINATKDKQKQDYLMQLKEGYSGVKKAHVEAYKKSLEKIMSSCDMIIDGAKAKRKPRVRKAPSKEKQVAKVKYCETDTKYQVTSVNPIEMLDSKEIWVFNVKTRKLGKYVADETCVSMSVKGTTIVGFDQNKSIQKTLRKPEQTLKDFKKTGKVGLRKFMEQITTTDTKLTGRLNADTVILKTQK